MYAVASRDAERQSASSMNKAAATPESHGAPGRWALSGIRFKLKLDQPGDEYEQEADAIAERVMRSPKSEPLGGL
jgi:hypothetical protein